MQTQLQWKTYSKSCDVLNSAITVLKSRTDIYKSHMQENMAHISYVVLADK